VDAVRHFLGFAAESDARVRTGVLAHFLLTADCRCRNWVPQEMRLPVRGAGTGRGGGGRERPSEE
jgi:hypothetical protein